MTLRLCKSNLVDSTIGSI